MYHYSAALFLLVLVILLLCTAGFIFPARALDLPIATSFLLMAYFIPQALGAERAGVIEFYGAYSFWIYATFCLITLTAGFYAARNRRTGQAPIARKTFNTNRLLIAALSLVAIGTLAGRLAGAAALSDQLGSSWTGVATAYFMLSNLQRWGLCLCILIFFREPNTRTMWALILASVIIFSLFSGMKRTIIFDLAIALAGGWSFAKRIPIPRPVLIAGVIIGAVIVNQIGVIRSEIRQGGSIQSALLEGKPFERFEYFESEEIAEIQQAASDFAYLTATGDYVFGTYYWNQMVHQYVPAFILGREFKDSLKIENSSVWDPDNPDIFHSRGAVRTGFGDSFANFSYFGVILFLMLGYFFGFISRGVKHGGIRSQFTYLVLLGDGITTVLSQSSLIIKILPFFLVVSFLVFKWGAARPPRKQMRIGRSRRPLARSRPVSFR